MSATDHRYAVVATVHSIARHFLEVEITLQSRNGKGRFITTVWEQQRSGEMKALRSGACRNSEIGVALPISVDEGEQIKLQHVIVFIARDVCQSCCRTCWDHAGNEACC